MEKQHHRHGDVMLKKVTDSATISLVRTNETPFTTEVTIALGEATGHHHSAYQIANGAPSIRTVEVSGRRFLDVGAEYFLRHQEHSEQRIAPGVYEIIMENEYDPFEKQMKKVVD